MPNLPFLRSLQIRNFRGLRSIKIDPLRRITVLGGLNGVGKSTVLDSIFQMLDLNNPAFIARSAQMRQVPTTLELLHKINDGNHPVEPSNHDFATRMGLVQLEFRWGMQDIGPLDVQVLHPSKEPASQTSAKQDGYSLAVFKDRSKVIDRKYASQNSDEFLMKQDLGLPMPMPQSTYLQRNTIFNVASFATRYSNAVQQGRKGRLLEVINSLSREFQDMEILQVANVPVVHLSLDGVLLPMAFAGDGVFTIASIALAIMTSPGGLVLIDEFDASVHYSRLKKAWSIFHELCLEFDTQLIVATHSKECAAALFEALDANHRNDGIFYRLDYVEGNNITTSYQWDEMREATAEGWEFR